MFDVLMFFGNLTIPVKYGPECFHIANSQGAALVYVCGFAQHIVKQVVASLHCHLDVCHKAAIE